MIQHADLYNTIIDSAVNLASNSSWESLRLHEIAADLEISLADIYEFFAEKEQISDAWFERADKHMIPTCKSDICC